MTKYFSKHAQDTFVSISFVLFIFLLGCDYVSQGLLYNMTNDTISISTDGKIDGFYKNAMLLKTECGRYYYQLPPQKYDRIFSRFNAPVDTSHIYFKSLIINTKFDTINLFGKEKIIKQFVRYSEGFLPYREYRYVIF